MPIPKAVARFNRSVTNRIARLVAGWLPPFVIVLHRGRRSGRRYATPVWAFRTGDGLVVALTYGADCDWVRNVLASGGCEVKRLGRRYPLVEPRVLYGPAGARLVPWVVRGPLALLNATEFLLLSFPAATP